MKLKTIKIFKIVLVLLIILACSYSVPVDAAGTSGTSTSGALDWSKADDFITRGSQKQGISNIDEIGVSFSEIGKVLVYIGAGVLVGGLAYLGIMYMVSSPEKQGKLKQQLIGLLVAAIVIFGAYSIWSVLINILDNTIS